MNPILRLRIPACVRTLLTDIELRDERQYHREADDNETEAVTVDGIELPRRGVVDPGELLAPAGLREEREEGDKGSRKEVRICGLCLSKPPCYTCPRCNVPYCGLACYRGSAHSSCSEEFYKESVIRELRERGETEEEGKRRMQEILLRLNREGERKEEMIAEVLRDMEEGEREMDEGEEGGALGSGEVLVLLSRLAEIQSMGGADQGEVEDILTKLKEIGEKEADGGRVDETVARLGDVEESEEEEEQDIAERFSGLDIDSLSEEQLWALLPRQHRERFEGLVKGGAIGGLVPLWSSWWERHEGGEGALIELLEGEEEHKGNWKDVEGDSAEGGEEGRSRWRETTERGEKGSLRESNRERVRLGREEREHIRGKGEGETLRSDRTESAIMLYGNNEEGRREGERSCEKEATSQAWQRPLKRAASKRKGPNSVVPRVNKEIPPLSSLSSQPSPLVRYGLVNALYGYTYSLSLFNGDLSEPHLMEEFCQVVLNMSESLSSNLVFSSSQEALEAGARAATERGHLARADPGAQVRAIEAVAHVLTGKSEKDGVGYTLAALSQLRSVLHQARRALPKEDDWRETRQKYFLAGKKCEFLLSWVKDNGPAVRLLAGGIWREYRRREKERNGLDREKRAVEESWKKGRGRGKGRLIEEID